MNKLFKTLCLSGLILGLNGPSILAQDLKKVTLILDYVPNTNHTGIYWALDKGYYEEEGIDLEIIEPGTDLTSIQAVAAGNADLGVSYQEDLTYAQANQGVPVKAIATIMKYNTSGFVSLADSGIEGPADFEGKTYAGWQSPSEEAIIGELMKQAGADPNQLTMVGDTGMGPRGLSRHYDIQWYFEAWDNVKAELDGIELNYMPLRDYDERLDYYTPIFIAGDELIQNQTDLVQGFMSATKRAYQEVMANPEAAGDFMASLLDEYDADFIKASQTIASSLYTDQPDNWGWMEESVWQGYTDFMFENELIDQVIPADQLYTNEFLEARR